MSLDTRLGPIVGRIGRISAEKTKWCACASRHFGLHFPAFQEAAGGLGRLGTGAGGLGWQGRWRRGKGRREERENGSGREEGRDARREKKEEKEKADPI